MKAKVVARKKWFPRISGVCKNVCVRREKQSKFLEVERSLCPLMYNILVFKAVFNQNLRFTEYNTLFPSLKFFLI